MMSTTNRAPGHPQAARRTVAADGPKVPLEDLADRAEAALSTFREAVLAKDATQPRAPEDLLGRLEALEAEFQALKAVQALTKLGKGAASLPQIRARLDAVDQVYKEDRKRRFGNYPELLRLVAIMAVALGLPVRLDGPVDGPLRFLLVDLPTGQVSFGVKNVGSGPFSAQAIFGGLGLPETLGAWDGHTKDEKAARVRALDAKALDPDGRTAPQAR